ncbi:MAG: glycoside hydrolase family 9 protein [Bacillota bacterium]|nr:glycoside hydrolase family 9 protein [Bacillota bacterium]
MKRQRRKFIGSCILVIIVALLSGSMPTGLAFAEATSEPVPTAADWQSYNYFNYAEALQKSLYFYDAERCGPGITGGRLEWRGDCHVGDSSIPFKDTSLSEDFISKYRDILDPDGDGCMDLHGGYHDAGDHVRFGLPQGYAASTLAWGFYEFREAFKKDGEEQHMIDLLKQFSDTFLRCSFLDKDGNLIAFCYMVGEGEEDHTYWGPPELYPKTISRPADFATAEDPASDMCGETAASLALSYLIFKDTEPQYADKCLKVAKAMYDFGRKYKGLGRGDGFYNSPAYEDELAWAAVWLYVCTGNMDYINHIDSTSADGKYTGYMAKIIVDKNNSWQNIWVHCWDVVWGGVFTKLACLFPDNKDFDYFSRWNLEYWTGGKIPHQDTRDTAFLYTTPAGYGMINTWGSARYNCGAQLCDVVYQKYHKDRTDFTDWAKGQMEYLMGRNPMGYSYIVGYGYEKGLKYARHPHHRAAHGSKTLNMDDPPEDRHVLWGALVGGPDAKDYHNDVTTDFVYNEVAIDYNAAFVGALAGLYLLYGQDDQPIPNFPPKEPEIDDYYCDIKLEQENTERTQVTLKLHNESCHPPHFESTFKTRYFFNISELLDNGQSIKDVSIYVAYDEQGFAYKQPVKVNGPFKWDDSGTYYYEFDWTGSEIYGTREFQFALIGGQDANWKSHWDPTNDWSRKGAVKDYTMTRNVSVYLNDRKVFGDEPPKLEPTPSPTPNPSASPVNDAAIKVLYRCGETGTTANSIRNYLEVQNIGKSKIDLSDVVLRYWYTADGSGEQQFICDDAPVGATNVISSFNKIPNPTANVDNYCEITFSKTAGALAPGETTGMIQNRINKTDLTPYNQSNDYSFMPAVTSTMAENNKVTGYVKGILKYGVEPVAVEPSATPTNTGFKVSGYIMPDIQISSSSSALKSGFKVELTGTDKSALTDNDGYFEITGVDGSSTSQTIKVSKANFLYREIKNIVINKDTLIGSAKSPIMMWAGDIMRNGISDNTINMGDILEIAKSFNATSDSSKYNINVDLNLDGSINMSDVIIVSRHFSKTPLDYDAV